MQVFDEGQSAVAELSRAQRETDASWSAGPLAAGATLFENEVWVASARSGGYSVNQYPYSAVVFLEVYINGQYGRGSGAIIGPHTIITAAHVLWDSDIQKGAERIDIFPAYDGSGSPLNTRWASRYYTVDDRGGLITAAAAQDDLAIITTSADLSRYGSFGLQANYAGPVNITGYPAFAGRAQVDSTLSVRKDQTYSILRHTNFDPGEGRSGGPVWADFDPGPGLDPRVVGVVSTASYAYQLTNSDFDQIKAWQAQDAYIWGGGQSPPPPPNAYTAPGPRNEFWDYSTSTGNLALNGGAESDFVWGGSGLDVLRGGPGRDILIGGEGRDTLFGGDDASSTNDAPDQLLGGRGDDVAYGGAGGDYLNGEWDNDTLFGGEGADKIYGGFGADRLLGDAGDDVIFGGSDDRADGDWFGGAILIEWNARTLAAYGPAYWTIAGEAQSSDASSDTLYGGAGADVLDGGEGGDWLFGDDDADVALGQGGADFIFGGNGDDRNLNGGSGDDLVGGEGGADVVGGGDGRDTLWGGVGNDSMFGDAGADRIDGESGNDVLMGGADNDNLTGGEGDDLVGGEAGNDSVFGWNGADNVFGGAGDDLANGDDGDDGVFGEDGADIVQGGAGTDVVSGGAGRDELFGGPGADRFLFFATSDSRPGEADSIRDFFGGGGGFAGDRIDVSFIDANTAQAGDQAFSFVGVQGGPSGIGTLQVGVIPGVGVFLFGYTDGDANADLIIDVGLAGFGMGAGNFIL